MPSLPAPAAPDAGSSSLPGRTRTTTPSASSAADTPASPPPHTLPQTGSSPVAPPSHATGNTGARSPTRPSHSGAANTLDSDRSRKIVTCFFLAYFFFKNKPLLRYRLRRDDRILAKPRRVHSTTSLL